ncbi:non-hydrolyzing UDP-N-acetylglucosamine 2-epimerase [Aurantiacibacter odishensis]|uniref:non-hydrolyzing UDP-N-acetylglucosamine 2-epimerase n=1 Tax=Aurantiacibacter odishensis TaxID=1155476 RepID=UPI000E70C7BD|nr:UDP-N-acetylglucosamine 2-epimerase (non-hydrolyzing) [Aurantiacibacter odishensis]
MSGAAGKEPRILVCFGTRPEAIKMFPVVHALRNRGGMDVRVAVTAQHRDLLDQVLEIGEIVPDVDLDLMRAGQTLDELSARILTSFGKVLDDLQPDRVLVHGDTLTTMMVTLSSYFRKIPVGHVEAGLRSGNIYSPWPEEVNRKVAGSVSDLHFAPTQGAADALLAENVPSSAIYVTGNTVIDALFATRAKVEANPELASGLDEVAVRFADKGLIAVTAHRRENFGEGMQAIADAIATLANRQDVAVIFPVHPNPNVRPVMEATMGGLGNVALLEPLDYPHFVRLMAMADLLLTDSGGVQEEGPSFGKPVLVMRDTTERPEGIEAGTAKLVGTDRDLIVREATRLLDDAQAYEAMARAHNPYGDGKASARIADAVAEAHGVA